MALDYQIYYIYKLIYNNSQKIFLKAGIWGKYQKKPAKKARSEAFKGVFSYK